MLGPAVARLAHVWSSTLDLSEIARPVMAEAWTLTAETVALFVPRADMRLCVAEMQSPQPLSFRRGVGYSEKLVRGASGRARSEEHTSELPSLLRTPSDVFCLK